MSQVTPVTKQGLMPGFLWDLVTAVTPLPAHLAQLQGTCSPGNEEIVQKQPVAGSGSPQGPAGGRAGLLAEMETKADAEDSLL